MGRFWFGFQADSENVPNSCELGRFEAALADVDGNGQVEIVVSLKDAEDKVESVIIYTVPGSTDACLLWPTGRGNDLRNGLVP